jgi:hypothetical protein
VDALATVTQMPASLAMTFIDTLFEAAVGPTYCPTSSSTMEPQLYVFWCCRKVTIDGVPANDPLWPQQEQLLDLIASRIGAAVTTQV